MITLCGFAISNYYNVVKMALLEKGIAFAEELDQTKSQDEAVLSCSPLGKIPFIRTAQGALCESHAILEYLEMVFPLGVTLLLVYVEVIMLLVQSMVCQMDFQQN